MRLDWDQVTKVGQALLFSPVFGFVLSALLLLLMKAVIRVPELYQAPKTTAPPSPWIRGLLVLTCTPGCWNLLGVLASSGAVAFGIVSLLPVELILQVGSAAGYAMRIASSSACASPSSARMRKVSAASASSRRLMAKPTWIRTQSPTQEDAG
jgi:PiT family inorganic phosphate transporter